MLIKDFYRGKNVFITGGTGFLGKVLIEKLLRSCPDIGNIYMLIREKKGKSIEERMTHIKSLPLFELLKNENPENLNKIIPVKGDVREINLGLSEADRQMIIDNVNIIYHTAASVRFDDFLKDAIFINVIGTREVAKLALELKQISIFIHVSTTYCNVDKPVIEEKCYNAHAYWRDAIEIAENCDEATLNGLTEKYIRPLPNTYTFAKSLAENVVDEMCRGKIPVLIMRPSVVIATLKEPMVGWIDNLNGPVGLLVAGGKGILRIVYGVPSSYTDYIPVDIVTKFLIAASRDFHNKINKDKIEVFNMCQGKLCDMNIGEIIEMGSELRAKHPFSKILWYPRFSMTSSWLYYYINVLLFHMLPAFFIDVLLRITGAKPMLFSIQRKIYIANVILMPFMSNTWCFKNEEVLKILERLLPEEQEVFADIKFVLSNKEKFDYFRLSKIGSAKYVLKEDFDESDAPKRNLKRLWYLDIGVKTIFFAFLFWSLIIRINLLGLIYDKLYNYIDEL
ncbi:putative fatty acyl-CoA reductase CG5065 [Diorhabda sublineata]|uniref:putative fatty acyl-CoA reductase CG5065 n=1 Tax=Diorhabda sublineata TaxID=1163346 RepID=UPI0024E06FD2|nr:putative fatty acyl-CoA reductase CG5065 [Diorhabda sublineata]